MEVSPDIRLIGRGRVRIAEWRQHRASFAATAIVVVTSVPAALAQTAESNAYGSSPATRTSLRGTRFDGSRRLRIPDPLARRILGEALARAESALAEPSCAKLLEAFTDGAGRALSTRLESLDVDVQTYLTFVVFMDDSRHAACTDGVIAFTSPGSRVVRVCSAEMTRTWQGNPSHVVAAVIHEMLHTLGLGENPPPSHVITRQVLAQCRVRPHIGHRSAAVGPIVSR
jgi:hypothetical protein